MKAAGRFSRLAVGFGDDLQHLPLAARLVAYEVATTRLRTTIPGLVHVGVAGFAEACGLDVELVRSALDALQGVVHRDPVRPLLFMPRCVQQDPPANPNVLKAWSAALDELPNCALLSTVEEAVVATLGAAMRDEWNRLRNGSPNGSRNGLGNGSPNGSGNGLGNRMANPIPIPIPVPFPIPSTDTDTDTHTVSEALAERNVCAREGAPDEGADDETSIEADRLSESFELTWRVYPRQEDRPAALRAFGALNPDDDLVDEILAGIEAHRRTAAWTAEGGRYVPRLAKWLEREGWREPPGPPPYEDGAPVVERCALCGEAHGPHEDCLPVCADCRSRHAGECFLAKERRHRAEVDAENRAAAAAAGLSVEELQARRLAEMRQQLRARGAA